MNSETNFWISDEIFNEDIPIENRRELYRSAIKNFVKIITEKEIPVQFKGEKNYTDGKSIWIDEDFSVDSLDSTVGIILHESCHILHTNFDIFKTLWMKIPKEASQIAKEKKIDIGEISKIYKKLLNYVEDRFIDNWAYDKFIGYRGYYVDLYNRFWNNKKIGMTLSSNEFRDESIDSYMFRIINLTNKSTDLSALNGLEEIYNELDLDNINRLIKPIDRLDVAKNILLILLRNIEKIESESKSNGGDSGDILNKCEEWVEGNYEKLEDGEDKQPTDKEPQQKESKYSDEFKLENDIKCILIKNINAGNLSSLDLPIAKYSSFSKGNIGIESVNSGIVLGKILASKWKIRGEINKTLTNRQVSGKIDKRLLFSVGTGNDRIFTRSKTESYKKCHIHISIDASGSMSENDYGKWKNSIICAVAIAKATSVTENVEVVISFRTTIKRDDNYPCLVIAYDSRKDKFNKVYSLFPLLHPGGGTPEGLLFPLISSVIPESNHELDSIFINFSDGMPYFQKTGINFCGAQAIAKTKQYFTRMQRDKNLLSLCYYIGEDNAERLAFSMMYGKDSNFIDVKEIITVSKTITNKILRNKKVS
jgi:hypothetical protein